MDSSTFLSLVNLSGQFFKQPEVGYYNLATNRVIQAEKPRERVFSCSKYRVAGTPEELCRFGELNSIEEKELLPEDQVPRIDLVDRILSLFSSTKSKKKLSNLITNARVTNIETFDFNSIHEYGLLGLTGKCKVIEVIDSDTFLIGVSLPIDFLREENVRKIGNKTLIQPVTVSNLENAKIFLKLRVRFAGIDGAESNTHKGKAATIIVTELFEKYKNIVYYRCLGSDKYGRELMILYFDEGLKSSIGDYLLINYPDMFEGYYGKTKSDRMKNMERI